jgi:lipopolysaccharide heptosyltransferase II
MLYASEMSVKSIFKAIYLNVRGFALSTVSLFTSRQVLAPVLPEIRNILFIRIDRVGDMVLSTPAFRAMKAALPTVRLTVMASPANAPTLKNNPDVDEIIVYHKSASLFKKMKLINGLKSRRFDLAIDPYTGYEVKTAWLAAMSGAAHRIGYAAFGREIFFSLPTPMTEGNKHFVDGALYLLKRIGIPIENRNPAIYLGADEQAWAGQWLQENGFHGKKIVAIHPGAYYDTQRWLPEHYAELIRLIQEQTSLEAVLMGGPSDAMIIDNIQTKLKRPVCVSIQENMRNFFALLSQCQMFVCNNSGPLHCAGALKIPTVSFMGPTVKELWTPVGDIHRVLRLDDLPCIGCNSGWCKIKTNDCMRLIRPDSVIGIIQENKF